MKIAILNKYQNKVNRGAETFVTELSKRLLKKHSVDVLPGFQLKRYDLIIPTNGRFQALVTRLWTWITGSKMIISGQSGIGFDDRLNLYSFPDYFIALSDFAYKWAKKINPFIKIVKIPNGVDLEKYSSSPKKTMNIVLSVGAFTENKRHDLTIRAVSKLEDVKLIIVGSGGDRRIEIENLGKKLLGDRFKLISLKNDKMPTLYKKASILAFPTVSWESFGIAIVEAMASGIPVVTNNDPIRKEIIGDAGILVDPKNIEKYSKALSEALTINWGDKPLKQARKFDWDKIAESYEKLISTL